LVGYAAVTSKTVDLDQYGKDHFVVGVAARRGTKAGRPGQDPLVSGSMAMVPELVRFGSSSRRRVSSMQLTQKHQEYWGRNLKMTGILLAIWFVVTFVASFFARELNGITVFGFPLGFYMGAQGSLVVYVLIIWYYARQMNKLDEEYGVHEGDD
jgi:putative solute:sodium symporter small subunit